jgi:hypothetical protein
MLTPDTLTLAANGCRFSWPLQVKIKSRLSQA